MSLRTWYDRNLLPRLIHCACGMEAIEQRRCEVVSLAEGRVFELGCGGGLNQKLYDRSRVTALAGIDPHEQLLESARSVAASLGWNADLRQASGEDIPFADGSFDTVICTYTLCSVQDHSQVIREMRRILQPNGRLLFLEHGRAPDARVMRWQMRIEPFWKPLAGGCHLTRGIGSALRANGFAVEPIGQAYLDRVPRPLGWMEWGVARHLGA